MMHELNEAETRAELIDPAIKAAGWGEEPGSRVRREMIAPGQILGGGRRAREKFADYVLIYQNHKLAVIEAKKRSLPDTEGLAQAKDYAQKLQARFAISTNGEGIYRVDMQTGEEGRLDRYPTPEELWEAAFGETEARAAYWRQRFAEVPFEDKGGYWEPRYYQHNAINRVLEAMGEGRDRILLTLATGTGKTAIAFQLAWKLFHSRWNLTEWRASLEGTLKEGETPTRRPRILFLADRNILADQALTAFSAFPDDALKRISPDEIKKEGRVPKNGSIFFTIFQTFMSGSDEEGMAAPNFFDFIIIDECHRGGANDESNWRGILEYFSPAVQLGLTATPKRDKNVDTYHYFGEPVYIYSLKEGINDGFLTPFKVKQISTTLDDYVYTSDDDVVEGEVEEGRLYKEEDFNRVIEIKEREKFRVQTFMDLIDQGEKTLVFCATQLHALAVRDLVNQLKRSKNPDYCHRVTANDGKNGERHLDMFKDNEKTIPTILTTSQKLSTGVDARNVRNIVLMRPINSMIEFKQIIGRGTRLFDGKDYFTIYDFVKAYEHFNDAEWDGEPVEPVVVDPTPKPEPDPKPDPPPGGDDEEEDDDTPKPKRLVIKLADRKARAIQKMTRTMFWGADGKPLSAEEFMRGLYGELPAMFKDEEELREIWGDPATRRRLLLGLSERGYGREQLLDLARLIDAEGSDLYDVLAYVAYAREPMSRADRVDRQRDQILAGHSDKQREFLEFILDQYVKEGVDELDDEKLPDLLELKYHSVHDALPVLGPVQDIRNAFVKFQPHLYAD